MQLKVGELARSSGLTVRTLHHYDEIGLLKPSGRSDAGYRLYSQEDVARLHGIQALRHLGLALNDIAGLLDGQQAAPDLILEQQMRALDREIAQATELRGRLALIRDGIREGTEPAMQDWLKALSLMATYGKYFSSAELKAIFSGFKKIEREWHALLDEVRVVMDRGAEPASADVQVLARRWMGLVHYWMEGDFVLMERWGDMYRREPSAHGHKGGPPTDMFAFMQAAIELRMGLMLRHLTKEELGRIRPLPEAEWAALNADGLALLATGALTDSPQAQALRDRWLDLQNRLVGGDQDMRRKLLLAQRSEPLLLAGSPLAAKVRDFLLQGEKTLDPHVT
ncbi:MerR family transcriptional regulator [Caenimonas sedimenti]|uniref:MerR family transcriptional regulator n=1 Tax=Caenimonas sedimenti TaxID=2596921 RepID=A0A562ZQQ7_9BURK|nr:MerR family transcriptional regulator [Caenimonas sedimenti]TWO70681.1 MerR family transcriptional regulator [Caenimonas sedimenti]